VSYSDGITLTTPDTIAPSGSISVNAGVTYTNTTASTLTLSANDTGGSGMSQMRFSNDNSTWSTWESYVTSKSWALTAGNGAKTVYVQYRDVAGNVSTTYSDGITLDTALPTTASNIVSGQTYTGAQLFTLTPGDTGGSGVAGTWWQLDSTAGAWTSGTSVSVTAPASGTVAHTLYWYSRDTATNQEVTKSVAFSVAAVGGSGSGTQSFSFTGADQSFTVPAGVTEISVDLYGGQGGDSGSGVGGLGGRVQAVIPVTPGSALTVRVGGEDVGDSGGWPNGGYGGECGAGGGGSTSLLAGAQILVEAGAGGGGDHDSPNGIDGEPGGWQGTLPGGNQHGGDSNDYSAGGGGGWNGGDSGDEHSYAGGGGSSYIAVGTGTLTPGVRTGNGSVTITW